MCHILGPQPVPGSRQSWLIPFALLILGLGCSIQSLKRKNFLTPPPHSPFTSKFCWSLQAEVLLVTRCQCPVPPKPFRPPAVLQPLGGTQHPPDPHCPAGPRLQQLFFSPQMFSLIRKGVKRGAAAAGSSVSSSSLLLPVLRDSQSPASPAKAPLSLRDISLLPQPSH